MAVATALLRVITQAAHSLVVGNVVYLSGASYVAAKADAQSTAEVIGIVTTVTDVNTFTLTYSGYCNGLVGLLPGTVYFLSDVTAGALTVTEPTTTAHISKPIFVALSGTEGYFINYRGKIIP